MGFGDPFLDNIVPGPYVVSILSILSPTSVLRIQGLDLPFDLNPDLLTFEGWPLHYGIVGLSLSSPEFPSGALPGTQLIPRITQNVLHPLHPVQIFHEVSALQPQTTVTSPRSVVRDRPFLRPIHSIENV